MSMEQALAIWSELERAYYDNNSYGGDTAELYLYRFMPYCPSIAHNTANVTERSGIVGDMAREAYDKANEALHDILVHFATIREANILVEDQELGPWLKKARYQHRVHVKVTPRRGR